MTPLSFKYVGHSNTATIEGLTDDQRWHKTLAALNTIGIKDKELTTLVRALFAILQLSNIVFLQDPTNKEGSIINNLHKLNKLSNVLGVDTDTLRSALTWQSFVTTNKVIVVPMTFNQAKDACDAFAKEI